MSEEFAEYLTEPFDCILAEDIRLDMEEALHGINSHVLDELSIKYAKMAWEWREGERSLEE